MPAMLFFVATMSAVLLESPLFRVSLDNSPSRVSILSLSARSSGKLDLSSAKQVLDVTDSLLKKNKPFVSLWDVRKASTPNVDVTWETIRWAVRNTNKLRRLNKKMAVVVPNNPVLRRVVSLVIKVADVRCPVLVTSNEREAETFVSS
jgi:hypothetical protein